MSDIAESTGWVGAFRAPRNMAADVKGSIHDDATASKLGFKGGTVAGSIHMDQFVPKLVEIHGERWFRDGGISLYFTQATVDGEKVRAGVETDGERCRLRMWNEPGDQICEGTAAVGGKDPRSELALRMEKQEPAEPSALRIYKHLRVGDEAHGLTACVTREALDRSLDVITEPMDVYRATGVLPPSNAVRLAHQTRAAVLGKADGPYVGLFGALEVQHLAGPLKADVAYQARTKILKLTESPKTENVWYDVFFTDPGSGTEVAYVRYLLRAMKNSSAHYAAG